MTTGLVDDALETGGHAAREIRGQGEHRTSAQAEPDAVMITAGSADSVIAVVAAIGVAAAGVVTLIAYAMRLSGIAPPSDPATAFAYFAFPLVEFALFTPVPWVSGAFGIALATTFWLCRRGRLPWRSPGMILAGVGRGLGAGARTRGRRQR